MGDVIDIRTRRAYQAPSPKSIQQIVYPSPWKKRLLGIPPLLCAALVVFSTLWPELSPLAATYRPSPVCSENPICHFSIEPPAGF